MVKNIDFSSLWKKEDWIAVWIGFSILTLAIIGALWWLPRIDNWYVSPAEILSIFDIPMFILLYLLLIIFVYVGTLTNKEYNFRLFIKGFTLLYIISVVSFMVAKQYLISSYGLSMFCGRSYLD